MRFEKPYTVHLGNRFTRFYKKMCLDNFWSHFILSGFNYYVLTSKK